jgi:predicted dehydrogenase
MDKKIQWGIIGCGDVTEVKSGPAFNKVPGSALIGVMRRDEEKAKDYARRHGVPKYYRNAQQLIDDPDINAIYIATPPGSHEEYALAAIEAGKPVYVEKPMALNYAAAKNIQQRAEEKNVKLVVAHYRNAQPFFQAIQQMIPDGSLGDVRNVDLVFNRIALTQTDLQQETKAWRVDPAISGGGLFHDMAPHQVGLMLNFFGNVKEAGGQSFNTNDLYKADDNVTGNILFENGIAFTGSWNFNASADRDECTITGTNGWVRFPVFGQHEMISCIAGQEKKVSFDIPQHVQQPMIERTVQYFLGNENNPCNAAQGCETMRVIELFTRK